jgi:UDP-N-acetylglucosamine acyltransferase
MIHPTAIVDPQAELGSEVEIGPGVVIEGPVELGSRCHVEAHAVLTGRVKVGRNNRIGYGAVIGSYPQDLSFDPTVESGVVIGDDNVIREYCTIHRGTKADTFTRMGSNNFLMVGAHLGHNVHIGDQVILANNVLLGGYVEVHDRAFLGGGSVAHQFSRIGATAILQGTAAIGKDIPPFCIAAGRNSVVGINVVGLRRAGFDVGLRREVKAAFHLLFESGLTISQAAAQAAKRTWPKEVTPFWVFVGESKRGICSYRAWSAVKTGSVDQGDV